MKINILKKYYFGQQQYRGVYILCLELGWFNFNWFTDCDEWFIYIHFGNWFYRFSSVGNSSGRKNSGN